MENGHWRFYIIRNPIMKEEHQEHCRLFLKQGKMEIIRSQFIKMDCSYKKDNYLF